MCSGPGMRRKNPADPLQASRLMIGNSCCRQVRSSVSRRAGQHTAHRELAKGSVRREQEDARDSAHALEAAGPASRDNLA